MAKTFHAQILTPKGKLFEGDVIGVQVPGTEGSFEMKTNHASIISLLNTGAVLVRRQEGEDLLFAVSGGVVEMHDNQLTLLAEAAEGVNDIDTDRARKAYDEARKNLLDKSVDRQAGEEALARAKNRLQIAGVAVSQVT